jgi:hypothetical protein
MVIPHVGICRRYCPAGLVQFGAVEREEHRLERGIAVEIVERFVRYRVVGERLSDWCPILDPLSWRWRVRCDRGRLLNGRRLWSGRNLLFPACGGSGHRQCDRDNDRRVSHVSHVFFFLAIDFA